MIGRRAGSGSAAVLRPLAERAGRHGIAGPALEDALEVARRLTARGMAASLCVWNAPGDPPQVVAARGVAAAQALHADAGIDADLSVKAPALGFASAHWSWLVGRCAAAGVGLHLDALGIEHADRTLALALGLPPLAGGRGWTAPGRWARSPGDARVAADAGLRVRVVKGEWADPQDSGRDRRAGFLAVCAALAGTRSTVLVGTHEPALARRALRLLQDAGTPCELELLFGLPVRRVLPVAAQLGVPVRVYVPYGRSWLPYAIRSMSRSPRRVWWLMRDAAPLRGPGL
jgi:proline dehydrogenase